MVCVIRKHSFLLGLVVVFAVLAVVPAQAQYSKVYQFTNSSGSSQTSVGAILHGLESITMYTGSPWPTGTPGYTIYGGVFCTKLNFAGTAVSPGDTVSVGWRTADYYCYLRDLRWYSGTVPLTTVAPTQTEGLGGGGVVFYGVPPDAPPGTPEGWWWAICNDLVPIDPDDPTQGPAIHLTAGNTEFGGFALGPDGSGFSLEDLSLVASEGLLALWIQMIDDEIEGLINDIIWFTDQEWVAPPAGNSLIRKAENAIKYKHLGADAAAAGDLDKAVVYFTRAKKYMELLVQEVTNQSLKGNLDEYLFQRWVNGVPPDPAYPPPPVPALAIIAHFEQLIAGGQAPPIPLPDGQTEVVLYPGDCYYISLPSADTAYVLHGWIEGDEGRLDWVEQAITTPPTGLPPVIVASDVVPATIWPPNHEWVIVTLSATVQDDAPGVRWYPERVVSNQPELGTGDGDTAPDIMIDPALTEEWEVPVPMVDVGGGVFEGSGTHTIWLRRERAGTGEVRIYTIYLQAVDQDGNLSEPAPELAPGQIAPPGDPRYLQVFVEHDEGG